MKKNFVAAALAAFVVASSCSNQNQDDATTTNGQEQHEGMHHGDSTRADAAGQTVVETPDYTSVAEPFKTKVSQLVDEYLKLTDALVASDAEAAKAAANQVLSVAKAMPVAAIAEQEAKNYAEEKMLEVVSSTSSITGAATLDAQRENLEQLSEAVFAMAKAFDANSQPLYYQHCPMALNDKGGYWLSSNKEIRNPYFGDKMLKCGSTEEVLN